MASTKNVDKQIEALLNLARQKLQEGDGKSAIAYAINAATLKCNGDEGEVIKCLDAAKANAEAGRQSAMSRGARNVEEAAQLAAARAICDDMLQRDSILKDEREGSVILRHAMESGSSVVCVRCGGLFARDRFDAHRDYWCPKLGVVDSGDMDDLSDQMGNVRTTGRIPDGILYGDNRSHGSEGTFHQGSQQNTHDDGSMEEDEGYYCESF